MYAADADGVWLRTERGELKLEEDDGQSQHSLYAEGHGGARGPSRARTVGGRSTRTPRAELYLQRDGAGEPDWRAGPRRADGAAGFRKRGIRRETPGPAPADLHEKNPHAREGKFLLRGYSRFFLHLSEIYKVSYKERMISNG